LLPRLLEKFRVLKHLDLDIVSGVKRLSPRSILICAVSVALLALYLTVWISFAGSTAAKRSDFMIYYTAGRLPLSELYNIEAQRELEARVVGSPFPVKGEVLPFNHTPIFVPLLHLLVNDDYASSYLRWTALLWLGAFLCALVVFGMTGDVALAFAAASFYPLFTYIQQAHDTVFLLLGILLGAHLLSARKDLLAGIALSLTTLKPHFAIFLAVPLIARPKAFLGLCAASTLLAVYSVLLIGTKGVSDFLALLKLSAGGEGFGMRPLIMLNLLGLMERAGVTPDVARPIAWAAFFVAAILLLVLWKRSPLRPPFALTIVLAVFTSPHLYGHDLALLLASFATLTKPNALFLLVSSLALVALNIIPNNLQFAVVYLLMGALLFMSVKEMRRSKTHVLSVASHL
jgi:hypothetical protein